MIAKCVLVGDWIGRDTNVGEEIYEIHDLIWVWFDFDCCGRKRAKKKKKSTLRQHNGWDVKRWGFISLKKEKIRGTKWTTKKNPRQGTNTYAVLEIPQQRFTTY